MQDVRKPGFDKARPAGVTSTALALGLSSALLASVPVLAQDDEVINLDTLTIQDKTLDTNPYAEPGAPYKARISGDARYTRPLAETPANISVLTKAQIEDSGYTDLREILDAQPGITLGTGENGNAFGDRYIIRGQEARSDVFVDGLRDPGMTIRESFATEQVEISKGPNSSFAGRGTSGGGINSITKQASTEYSFSKFSGAIGTDDHTRITLDTNQVINDQLAVRANLLYAYEEVPDRGPTDRSRNGLALSALYQPTDNLRILLDYYGMEAEDNPDLGGYLVGSLPHRKPADNVPVYAQDEDFLTSDVDVFTARISYDWNPTTRIVNLTRVGNADNGYVTTGARATTTDASDPQGAYDTVSLSTHNGWQEVEYLANQTNLFLTRELAGLQHELILGVEYTDHSVLNGTYSINNLGSTNCLTAGRGGSISSSYCAIGPNGAEVANVNDLMNRSIHKADWDIDWQVKTTSLSLMDTFDLNDHWTVFAGLRYDRFDFDLGTQRSGVRSRYDYSDTLWNGHLGVTYQATPTLNLYATYATASDINGGESDVGTSSGYGGTVIFNDSIAGADPETTENLELGAKWSLNDDKLLLTAALFQITKTDVMEGDSGYAATGTFNTGENRVRGIELGISGNLTEQLSAQAGVTVMDAEILKSTNPLNEGHTLSNFAETTAFAQLRYQWTDQFAVGTAVKYEDEKFAGQPDSAPGYDAQGHYTQPVPSYTVVDLFADYRFNKQASVRLNVGNVGDRDYYLAAYRSGSFLYLGDARNVRLTFNYDF